MISIKLPIKVLKDDSQQEKDRVEDKIYEIFDKWLLDNPSFKTDRVNLTWGTYFDIQGKGLPDGSPQRMWLFRTIKAAL